MTLALSRRLFVVPRPTGWHLFVGLLILALGMEYWDKDPLILGGLPVPWPTFVLALVVLPLTIGAGARRWGVLARMPRPLAPMLLFWGACGLSIVAVGFAPGPSSVAEFLRTFAHLTMYVVFVVLVVSRMTWPRLNLFVRAYYVLGVVAALLALVQYVHGNLGLFPALAPLRLQSAEHYVGRDATTGFRASSFFGEPSWAARYYVHFMAIALASWWHTRERRHIAALALFLLAFYAANSLLGYVILATFALAVTLAQMWRKNMFSLTRRQKVALTVALYGCILLWFVGVRARFPDLIERSITRVSLIPQGGGAAGNRMDGPLAGLRVWSLSPVFGVGLGNIDEYIVGFYQEPEWVFRSQFSADNTYVQVLAETGVPGLVAFLWFWWQLVWLRAPRGIRAHLAPDAARAYGWLRFLQIDLLAQAVGMMNSADYLNPHLWTVVAIVLSCKTLILRELRAPAAARLA